MITEKEMALHSEHEAWFAAQKADSVSLTNSIAFVTLAEKGDIDDVTSAEHPELFSEWAFPVEYKAGNIRRYNENLYKCLQNHTSQEDWNPEASVSLWKKVGDPTVEYPEWSQPIGAGDAYMTDDKVSHNKKRWHSTIDNNVWEPGVYGWEQDK